MDKGGYTSGVWCSEGVVGLEAIGHERRPDMTWRLTDLEDVSKI
jgi:hypothetical protein